jgi:predicted nuclease with TOPRIM domain
LEHTLNTKLRDLRSDNEHLIEKLQCKSEENDKFRDDNRSLKNKVDEQFNEILSLKTQLSSMFLTKSTNSDVSKVERAASEEQVGAVNQKSKDLLISTSKIKSRYTR